MGIRQNIFLLDFIYAHLSGPALSSTLAPIPINMEISAYFTSISAAADTWLFSELK